MGGGIATINLTGFIADQQVGITRSKNPDIMWPWWHEIMRKKEAGEIPMKMPGYMLCKYRNEPEERWTSEREEEFSEFIGALIDSYDTVIRVNRVPRTASSNDTL